MHSQSGISSPLHCTRGVAQLVSALRSGRRGRAFESPHPDNNRSERVQLSKLDPLSVLKRDRNVPRPVIFSSFIKSHQSGRTSCLRISSFSKIFLKPSVKLFFLTFFLKFPTGIGGVPRWSENFRLGMATACHFPDFLPF